MELEMDYYTGVLHGAASAKANHDLLVDLAIAKGKKRTQADVNDILAAGALMDMHINRAYGAGWTTTEIAKALGTQLAYVEEVVYG